MIPHGAQGVGHIAQHMMTVLAPNVGDAYMAADLGMTASLIAMVAQDYDRAVEVLVADLDQTGPLLREAAPHLGGPALALAIADLIGAPPPGLRVSALSARADAAMSLLIDVHERVERAEAAGEAWAAPLNRRIWGFLDDYGARRAYSSPL